MFGDVQHNVIGYYHVEQHDAAAKQKPITQAVIPHDVGEVGDQVSHREKETQTDKEGHQVTAQQFGLYGRKKPSCSRQKEKTGRYGKTENDHVKHYVGKMVVHSFNLPQNNSSEQGFECTFVN